MRLPSTLYEARRIATFGATSLSSSSHLPPSEPSITTKPVALPPGRARLATKPLPTGSARIAKTMGMVRVSCNSAAVVGVVCERMRSGCSATSSFANRCVDSGSAAIHQRVSVRKLRPSTQPNFCSSCTNDASCDWGFPNCSPASPSVHRSAASPRAAAPAQRAATPPPLPSVNMNSRRPRWIAMRPSRRRPCECNRGNDITL